MATEWQHARLEATRVRAHRYLAAAVRAITYRYELRRGEKIEATGHLTRDTRLEVGDRIAIGSSDGIVRSIAPILGEREIHLVIQLMPSGLDL